MAGRTERKKHDPAISYQHKIERITKWYNHMITHRQEKDGKGRDKKPLKPLEFFINQVKKPKEK